MVYEYYVQNDLPIIGIYSRVMSNLILLRFNLNKMTTLKETTCSGRKWIFIE